MSTVVPYFKKRVVWVLLAMLLLGIVIAVLPLIFPAEQCPTNYSPKSYGDCIIGADIGGGLAIFFGIILALIAIAGLFAEILSSHRTKETAYITAVGVVIGLCLLVVGIVAAPLQNRAEVEKLYGCYTINKTTGEGIYPAGYNYSNYKHNYHCDNLKGAPGAKIKYANEVVYIGALLFIAGCIGIAKTMKPKK